MTLRGKGLAIGLASVAGGALLTTILMSRHAGGMMGATAEGRALLSAGAVVVDVAVCLSGMAGCAFVLSRGWFRRSMGAAFLVLMLGLVTLAVFSITNFIAAERMSVAKASEDRLRAAEEARQNAQRAVEERRHAAEEAAKQQREAMERLAQSQLGFMQAEVKGARGKERKVLGKDFAASAARIIAEVGKAGTQEAPIEQPITPPISPDGGKVLLRTESGPEMMAEFSGYSQNAISVVQIGGIAIALIIIEALFSMGAGVAWRIEDPSPRRGEEVAPKAEPITLTPSAPEIPSVAVAALPPPAQVPEQPPAQPLAEAAPEPVAAAPAPGPVKPVRVPVPGSIPSLQAVDFPVSGRPERLRHRDTPKDAARRFVTWMQAMGLAGSYDSAEITTLYLEFVEADFREPTSPDHVKGALETTRGCEKQRPKTQGKQLPTRYVIAARKYKLPAPEQPPAVTEPADNSAGAQVVRPRAFFRELEDEPLMRREWAHLARRFDRARKQRGARTGRRAA